MNKELQNKLTHKDEDYKWWEQVHVAQNGFRHTDNAMQG